MKNIKLPKTDSIEKLARFWDKRDISDFEEELEEVSEPVFERQTMIPLHLKSSEAKAVAKIAKAKGIADEELIREWIRQKIRY